MRLYSVYDRVSMLFNDVFLQVNDACAIRAFKALINKDTNFMSGDLDLYYLGEVDKHTGEYCPPETNKPIFLYRLSEVEENG